MSVNRQEFFSLVSSSGADKNLRWDKPLYVKLSKIKGVTRKPESLDSSIMLWADFHGHNPYTSDVDDRPFDGAELYINYEFVKDGHVDLATCQYYRDHGMEDIHAGSELAWEEDSFDEILGQCVLAKYSTLVMVNSRGDGVFTAEQIASGSGLGNFHNGVRNFSHNPSHAMRKAILVAQENI